MSNLTFKTGDLFTTKLPAIGHGVNIYGVMGSGIAPIVRKNFPAVYEPYRIKCLNHELIVGTMLPVEVEPDMWVFNLASQDKPGPNAKASWLKSSLQQAFAFAEENNLNGFAVPRIGAGIGGLTWDEVKTIFIEMAAKFPTVELEVWSLPDADS